MLTTYTHTIRLSSYSAIRFWLVAVAEQPKNLFFQLRPPTSLFGDPEVFPAQQGYMYNPSSGSWLCPGVYCHLTVIGVTPGGGVREVSKSDAQITSAFPLWCGSSPPSSSLKSKPPLRLWGCPRPSKLVCFLVIPQSCDCFGGLYMDCKIRSCTLSLSTFFLVTTT